MVDKVYDKLGQVVQQGQPRYVNQTDPSYKNYLPTAGQTINWTTTEYDEVGRATKVTEPDNTATVMTYTVSTGDSLLAVRTEDAKKHLIEQRSDVFHRLTKVIEIGGTGTSETLTISITLPLHTITILSTCSPMYTIP